MIPKYLESNFKIINKKTDGYNNIMEGVLICCDSQEFEVIYNGNIKKNFFSKAYLFSENRIILEAKCKKCGKIIHIFDNYIDGYDQIKNKTNVQLPLTFFNCGKCSNNNYSLTIKYEYPMVQELKELKLKNIDNAFTWIWVSIKCNNCHTKYKNFINYETG